MNTGLGRPSFLSPAWRTFSFGYADLSIAATVNTIVLCSLPAGSLIQGVVCWQTEQWAGSGLGALNVDIGTVSLPNKLTSTKNLMNAPGPTEFEVFTALVMENLEESTDIIVTASSDINLEDLTGGACNIALLLGRLF